MITAELIDLLVQTFLSPALGLKVFSFCQEPKLIDEPMPDDEERAAGLVAAEAVQQLDRSTAPQTKQMLDNRPINDGHVEDLQLFHDLGNLQQPRGFRRHSTGLPSPIMLPHSCAAEGNSWLMIIALNN